MIRVIKDIRIIRVIWVISLIMVIRGIRVMKAIGSLDHSSNHSLGEAQMWLSEMVSAGHSGY